ncbi:MAG: hypothetical protein WBA68_02920 [Alteraurantiacibacter sp.]
MTQVLCAALAAILLIPLGACMTSEPVSIAQDQLRLEFPPANQKISLRPLLVVLSDERDRAVFQTQVAPPVVTLASGQNVAVRETLTDIPVSAQFVQIGWTPE